MPPLSRRRRAAADPAVGMTLMEHLGELRNRVFKALVALAVGAVIGFLLYNRTLSWLTQPYCDVKRQYSGATASCRLVVTDPLESFSVRLKLSSYLGFLFASPFVLWQLWRFITPGLYEKEKRYAIPFVGASVLLFVMGAGLALLTFDKALQFFAAFGGDNLELLYTPSKYLNLLVLMMVIFGLGFEFPIVLSFLQLAGVLSWRKLSEWRRWAVVTIFVVDAVVTPSGDPITLLAMAVPMCIFYEISILLGRFVFRRS
jgi:sec-independent protein translocase protein TatC